MRHPSFATTVKQELAAALPGRPCCQRAELAGLLAGAGARRDDGGFTFRTELAGSARVAYLLARSQGWRPSLGAMQQRRLRRGRVFVVEAGPPAVPPPKGLPIGAGARRCCRRSWLRGLFLACGSVNDPLRGHHFELVPGDVAAARAAASILEGLGVPARTARRGGRHVVYLKGATAVLDALRCLGADGAVLRYEEVRVLREVRSQVNRLVNADTANLSKAIDAAARQLEDIRDLQALVGLDRLPASLRLVAELRRAHPDLSLRELGQRCRPPLGKSLLNHRLRRLHRLAEEARARRAAAGRAGASGRSPAGEDD
ncbi:MAG: DNA-binding protein WhiA [Clostridia bacterium]|nr:DNA-binding protein WhiA [Clostridia bacterium]